LLGKDAFPIGSRGRRWALTANAKARARRPGLSSSLAVQTTAPAGYATLRKALLTPLLIGSTVSVATFWANTASSFVCSESVSNCLWAWAVESSTTSESDFTSRSSRA